MQACNDTLAEFFAKFRIGGQMATEVGGKVCVALQLRDLLRALAMRFIVHCGVWCWRVALALQPE